MEPWEQKFLDHYSEWGSISHGAKVAGVTIGAVKAHRENSERFAALYADAHTTFIDALEKRLVELSKGNSGFLAAIARLKAELPNKYNDKLQVSGAVAHLHAAPPMDEVRALLRSMVIDALPETRAAITGDVIDMEAAGDDSHQPKE